MAALGSLASALPWQQYRQLLGIYLRRLNRVEAAAANKHVIRAVCAILDAFHFLQADPDGNAMDADDRAAIERQLIERVLPSMAAVLVQGDVVRAPVGLALVKLLRILPEDVQAVQLPRTLRHVANVLKNRSQGVRCVGCLGGQQVDKGKRGKGRWSEITAQLNAVVVCTVWGLPFF